MGALAVPFMASWTVGPARGLLSPPPSCPAQMARATGSWAWVWFLIREKSIFFLRSSQPSGPYHVRFLLCLIIAAL